MIPTDGFSLMLNNFYSELQEGLAILGELIKENKKDGSADIDTFLGMSLEKPDFNEDPGQYKRWQVKVALYKTLLKRAGYTYLGTFSVRFEANENIRKQILFLTQTLNLEWNFILILVHPCHTKKP